MARAQGAGDDVTVGLDTLVWAWRSRKDIGVPHADAEGITEDLIRAVVVEFYRRARRDDRLGPVFEAHVDEWDGHLARMTDFWSAALLRTGRYSGRPVEQHRAIAGLSDGHFDRWVELFEATVRDLCSPRRGRGVPRPRPADAGRDDARSWGWATRVARRTWRHAG